MSNQLTPTIGEWYKSLEGRTLEVVALDEDADTVEVQYFDGAVGEYDLDTWNEMGMSITAPPEDWSGPYDDLENDDFGDTERPMHPEDWDGPWNELDREA